MTAYDVYVFFLCLVVFTLLTALFAVLLTKLIRYYIKLVKCGAEDENIKTEYAKAKQQNSRGSKALGCICATVVFVVTAVIFVLFAVSAFMSAKTNAPVADIPMLKVVKSNSMACKNANNDYLFDNNLNNQIQTFDLIVLHKLPKQEELKQYDIVAYERDGNLILHRIVNIEEPNAEHPQQRYFLLQGDAVEYPDKFPVLYEDMRGIYQNEHLPFIGSFFMFMQSPAGWLCILLILFAMVATPIAEKKIKAVTDDRYALIHTESVKPLPIPEDDWQPVGTKWGSDT